MNIWILLKAQTQWHPPLTVVWWYQDRVALHQVIFNNHGHTQVGSCQGPQDTDRRRRHGQ